MKNAILLLLLAALALPAAAAAEEAPSSVDVEGPALLKGKGRLSGELAMANPAETRPVAFGGRLGGIRLVDLAGDLRVHCRGRGSTSVREDDEGHKVYVCRGRGGRVQAHGSRFAVQLVARRYGVRIPAGVTGTLTGRFRSADDAPADRGDRTMPPSNPADPVGPPSDEEIDAAIDAIVGGNG